MKKRLSKITVLSFCIFCLTIYLMWQFYSCNTEPLLITPINSTISIPQSTTPIDSCEKIRNNILNEIDEMENFDLLLEMERQSTPNETSVQDTEQESEGSVLIFEEGAYIDEFGPV